MDILLISNAGHPKLGHCKKAVLDMARDYQRVFFLPFAKNISQSHNLESLADALSGLDKTPEILTKASLSSSSKDLYITGGGNTFRLLKHLHDEDMIWPLRKKLMNGCGWVGWSAGANICGPNILTSNDWNVVRLTRFDALNLVPFNINPHYRDEQGSPGFTETREFRIRQFLDEYPNPVIGLDDNTSIRIDRDNRVSILGEGKARIFRKGCPPLEFSSGSNPNLFIY